jgi:cysteine desulfurase
MPTPAYLDHAATTPIHPEVRAAMLPYLDATFGNPSSAHAFGRAARAGLDQARSEIAAAVGCEAREVIFTSGGTEADNLAVVGAALAASHRGHPRLVAVSCLEHKAVLAAAHAVSALGGDEVVLPVDSTGTLDLQALDAALTRRPAVVSVMWVNNETGVVQPMAEIAARCQAAGVPLHCDGVQAFGKLAVNLQHLPISLFTLSGHKIGAPKGIGALVVRGRDLVEAIIHGGGQQFGIRPGTENVAGAVALGRAAALAAKEQAEEAERLASLRDALEARLLATVPELTVVAQRSVRAPHILAVCVAGADSEAMLMHLDMAGIAASGGSACSTGAVEPSHVLVALGVPRELALGALRFSFGHGSSMADVERVAEALPKIAGRVRRLSASLGRAGNPASGLQDVRTS